MRFATSNQRPGRRGVDEEWIARTLGEEGSAGTPSLSARAEGERYLADIDAMDYPDSLSYWQVRVL